VSTVVSHNVYANAVGVCETIRPAESCTSVPEAFLEAGCIYGYACSLDAPECK